MTPPLPRVRDSDARLFGWRGPGVGKGKVTKAEEVRRTFGAALQDIARDVKGEESEKRRSSQGASLKKEVTPSFPKVTLERVEVTYQNGKVTYQNGKVTYQNGKVTFCL